MNATEHALETISERRHGVRQMLRNLLDEAYINDIGFLLELLRIRTEEIDRLELIIDDMKKDAGLVPQDATSIDVLRTQNKEMKEFMQFLRDWNLSGDKMRRFIKDKLEEIGK